MVPRKSTLENGSVPPPPPPHGTFGRVHTYSYLVPYQMWHLHIYLVPGTWCDKNNTGKLQLSYYMYYIQQQHTATMYEYCSSFSSFSFDFFAFGFFFSFVFSWVCSFFP